MVDRCGSQAPASAKKKVTLTVTFFIISGTNPKLTVNFYFGNNS